MACTVKVKGNIVYTQCISVLPVQREREGIRHTFTCVVYIHAVY